MFNTYTQDYIYYETKLNENLLKNRKDLGKFDKGLTKKLSHIINKKRNSLFHLVNIPKQSLEGIKNYLSRFPKLKIILEIKKTS